MFGGLVSLAELLAPARVRVGMQVESKDELINSLVDLLAGEPGIGDLEDVRDDVWRRERQMSTGIGRGLALPHARTDTVTESVAALAITSTPVEFDSIDGEPVRVAFLLVGPIDDHAHHVALLGQISRLVTREGFIDALLRAGDAGSVIEMIRDSQKHTEA